MGWDRSHPQLTPLTLMSSDPNDLSALTAGHFLTGSSLPSMPERIVNDSKASTLQRFKAVTALKQSFWHLKWTSPSPNVAVGTKVLIHEDYVPPQHWRMGRIESLVYGLDNRVRVVQLRTAKGTCCRSQARCTSYVLKVDPFNRAGMLVQIINKILFNPYAYICTAVSPLITLRSLQLNERSEIKRKVVLVFSFDCWISLYIKFPAPRTLI